MAIQISNWVTELQKRTNLQGTDRILMGISSTGESLYTTVADLAGVVTGSTVVNRGNWANGTQYTQGDYVFAESTASPSERSMYFLIGTNPYVSNIPPKDDLTKWSELPAIKGDQGIQGEKGEKGDPLTWDDLTPAQKESLKGDVGDSGWSMLVRAEVDNVNLDPDGQYRKVLYVYDWVGGEGTKPTITGYIGVSGIVANIVNAENWRGSRGAQGLKGDAPAHEWVGTSVRFQNPNGTWGALTDLRGVQGLQGIKGDPPAHGWNGTSLRFQNSDGSWGAYVDLKGEKGEMGEGLQIDASGPLSGRSAYDSEPVNFIYWATDEGLFYIRANPTGWSTGQSLGAVANFLQLDDTPSSYSGSGGKVVVVKSDASGLEFVDRGVPYTGATKDVELGENYITSSKGFTAPNKSIGVLMASRRMNNIPSSNYILVKLDHPQTTAVMMGTTIIDVFKYEGQYSRIEVSSYKFGENWYNPRVSVSSGANYIQSVEFLKGATHTDLYIKVNLSASGAYFSISVSSVSSNLTSSVPTTYTIYREGEVDISGFTTTHTVTNAQFTRDPFYAFKTDIIGTAGQLPFTNSAGNGIELRKITPADLSLSTAGTILGNVGGNLSGITLSNSATNNTAAQRTATGQLKASNAVANDDLVALGQLLTKLNDYVLKEAGKGLSTNDLTNTLLTKLNGIATGATANQTDAYLLNRANHTGTQAMSTVTGLGTALDNKVDKVTGKGLSTEDYTTTDKNKVAALGTAASKNVGTAVGNVVEVQAGGKLPVLDGSNLTNLPSAGGGFKGFVNGGSAHTLIAENNNCVIQINNNTPISLTNWETLPDGYTVMFTRSPVDELFNTTFINVPVGVGLAGDYRIKVWNPGFEENSILPSSFKFTKLTSLLYIIYN